jgi:hypothetical protein
MSVQTTEIDQISWRSIASLLVRAFFCSMLHILGRFAAVWAVFGAISASSSGGIFPRGVPADYLKGALVAVLSILLLGASLFLFRIRPENGQRRWWAVFLGLVVLGGALFVNLFLGLILGTDILTSYLGIFAGWVALMIFLLGSEQIRQWEDWLGLSLALLIGMGLVTIKVLHLLPVWVGFSSDFTGGLFLSPVWLGMAFFPELLRFRTDWKEARIGFVLWAVFGLLSFWVFDIISHSMFG